MDKQFVVSVLDYALGELDVFKMFINENDDTEEEVVREMARQGHKYENCCYMYNPVEELKINIVL